MALSIEKFFMKKLFIKDSNIGKFFPLQTQWVEKSTFVIFGEHRLNSSFP